MKTSKFLSVLFLTMAGTTVISSAQEIDWAAESITITTEAQLRELAQRVNGTGGFERNTFEDQTFVLANDITLTGGNWEPIGRTGRTSDASPLDESVNFRFNGTFDGNGKVVSDLIIKGNINYTGFFGWVGEKGHVKNLGVNVAEYDVTTSWGGPYAGGIVGINEGTIEKCFATGDVKSGTTWPAYIFVGGLTGANSGIITECYATGNVNGFSSYNIYVGGLVGTTSGNTKILDGKAAIVNSYATGDISASGSGTRYMGGLVGDNGYSVTTTIVENCYSTGSVSGTGSNVGGLVGRNIATVTASYYDSETSGRSDTGKGEPKTTAEMKTLATFADWDFDDIWGIEAGKNAGYPYLWMKAGATTGLADILPEKWQIYPNPVKNELFITGDSPITKVEAFDISGHIVKTWHVETRHVETLHATSLQRGMYILKVYTGNGVVVKKIVKD